MPNGRPADARAEVSVAAGYSKKSLAQKLGIKDDSTLALLSPPPGYHRTLGKLPRNVRRSEKLEGSLWMSWPKGSSKVETDLSENVVREIGLRNGLVDVKICAVDETWSGLKFVRRLKDRKGR